MTASRNHKFSKSITFKLDNASGSLTALTSDVGQSSLQSSMAMLEDSALGDEESTYVPGLNQMTLPINGWINSTTEGIFGPLLGNRTSVTKTAEWYNGIKYYNGEFWPENVQTSGNAGELIAFSCSLRLNGALTRTSVALS